MRQTHMITDSLSLPNHQTPNTCLPKKEKKTRLNFSVWIEIEEKIYLSFVQTCYFWLIFDVVCSFHTTWTVKELRRHSQQQMFYPLPYRYHMIRLVKTFTGWDGVPVNHTHRDMTCIMLIWPHFCYSVSKREKKNEKWNAIHQEWARLLHLVFSHL